jgi:hypothetical protein
MRQRRSKRRQAIVRLAAATVIATALAIAVAIPSHVRAAPTRMCGVELWALKTLSDPQRGLVNLHPRNTTVAAINALPMPHPTPSARNTAFERRTYRVSAQIVQFKLEDDSDIHLILFSQGRYMIAEMPAAACLSRTTRDRRAIVAAPSGFVRRCGAPTADWQPLGAVAVVSGVGFWDFPHGKTGAARNYSELHPVTALRIVAGCG